MSYREYLDSLVKGIYYPKDWSESYDFDCLYYEDDKDNFEILKSDVLDEIYYDYLELQQVYFNLKKLNWEDIKND